MCILFKVTYISQVNEYSQHDALILHLIFVINLYLDFTSLLLGFSLAFNLFMPFIGTLQMHRKVDSNLLTSLQRITT